MEAGVVTPLTRTPLEMDSDEKAWGWHKWCIEHHKGGVTALFPYGQRVMHKGNESIGCKLHQNWCSAELPDWGLNLQVLTSPDIRRSNLERQERRGWLNR